jgi:hypothetical protein
MDITFGTLRYDTCALTTLSMSKAENGGRKRRRIRLPILFVLLCSSGGRRGIKEDEKTQSDNTCGAPQLQGTFSERNHMM